jgi:uncharacterized HhH-GPD family protein
MPVRSKSAPAIPVTSNPEANDFLVRDPLALLIGMLLDQQVPMEWAFLGPWTLRERLGGTLDATAIAAMSQDEVVAVFCDKPAVHRYPAVMARRAYDLCGFLVEHYDGDAGAIWTPMPTGAELYRRLRELPGYGDEKTRIFMAILAKRLGLAIEGWEEAAAPFSDDVPRSVADVGSAASLRKVREFKKAQKAAKRAKTDAPASA